MARLIKGGEGVDSRRKVYFYVVNSNGLTPSLGEAGGQPQISIDGGAWVDDGIGVLTHTGFGRYWALLDQSVLTIGSHIETRYKAAGTAEIPGDSVDVVAFDPYDRQSLGVVDIGTAEDLIRAVYELVTAVSRSGNASPDELLGVKIRIGRTLPVGR